ncbi:MAG: hypothetical protein WCJ61_17295 [Paludibacter sp.]
MESIITEILDASNKTNRIISIKRILNTKFESLLNWKYHSLDIKEFSNVLANDIEKFVVKQSHIDQNYSAEGKIDISFYYLKNCQYIFKTISDLRKLMPQFEKMVKVELSKAETEDIIIPISNSYILQQHNNTEFSDVLLDLYSNKFYPSVDTSVPLTQENILLAFAEFIQTEYDYKPSTNTKLPTSEQTVKQEGQKNFSDYLLHSDREKLAEEIKKNFNTEKSKSIRLLLGAMEQSDPPLITIIDGEKKALYIAMKEHFNRDIGGSNSIFQCKYDPDNDKEEKKNVDRMGVRLTHILSSL